MIYVWNIGASVAGLSILEKQMAEQMENEMETSMLRGILKRCSVGPGSRVVPYGHDAAQAVS